VVVVACIALPLQRQAGESGELAGEAEVAEEVGAVRRDLEVEDDIGGHELIERRADGSNRHRG
jgi:hypothetical protein